MMALLDTAALQSSAALMPHVELLFEGQPPEQGQMKLMLKCGALAARWQEAMGRIDAYLGSMRAHRGGWRRCKELVAVYDALRAFKHTWPEAKQGLAQVLKRHSARLMGAHEYDASTMMAKPHYFFTAAFDPYFLMRPPPPRLHAILQGQADKAELLPLSHALVKCTCLLRRTVAVLAGKGMMVEGGAEASRALRRAIHCLGLWQQHQAARVVQLHWRRCVADPSFRVCKRRLLREHQELVAETTQALPTIAGCAPCNIH